MIHLHEPVAPVIGWDTLTSADAPLVGTFHCYSESRPPHYVAALLGARRKLNRLHVRIAVSEAAAWTGRRFYGGHYRVVPNGVVLPERIEPRRRAPGEPLRIVFVGQAVERKGLPVLLRAFEALRGQVPAELTIVGATQEEIEPLLVDGAGVTALGRVDDAARQAALHEADLLCAPSLGGESFGMVLTEAFAAGRPVVASDIAGYRDVVTDGGDGLLVPRGDATRLAETLRDLALDPRPDRAARRRGGAQRRALRVAARRRAGRGGLRGRPRRAAARARPGARRGPRRRAARRPPAALARAPAGLAGPGPGGRQPASRRPPRGGRRGDGGRRGWGRCSPSIASACARSPRPSSSPSPCG